MYVNLMPFVGIIGIFILLAIYLIVKGMEKRARISTVDAEKFNSLTEDIIRENAEIKENLLVIKEKVEAIDYIYVFDALSHPVRIKIIGVLAEGRQYVSELARLVNISRPLLYIHLKKLETARLVTSAMEISANGKAMKYYTLQQFAVNVTKDLLFRLSEDIVIENPESG